MVGSQLPKLHMNPALYFPFYLLSVTSLFVCLTPRRMSEPLIAAVTGANKGIGYAIVRNIALQYPQSILGSSGAPLLIYLTARDNGRGQQAVSSILEDPELRKAKALQKDGGRADVKYQHLDISNKESIQDFEAFLKKQHPNGIDVLVNNAGVAFDGFDAGIVEKTLASNYHGTRHITETMLPHMRKGGRIVNVSSMAGKLNKYSPEITDTLRAARSVASISGLMDEYLNQVQAGTHSQNGWPSAGYAVSKAGVTGMTKAIGRSKEVAAQGVLVNSCCPGYVDTDMTKHRGRKTPDQGAQTPVKIALHDIGGTTGEFWQHEDVSEW